jgi:hypothetical protein
MVGQMAHILQNRTVYGIMVVKHEQKRPHGRPRHRQIDNVKVDHNKRRLELVYWVNVVQDMEKW